MPQRRFCVICGTEFSRYRRASQTTCSVRCGRIRRYGGDDPETRLWQRVDKNGPVPTYRPGLGPCWLWTAWLDRQGYGHIAVEDLPLSRLAHRAVYELLRGPIPNGLTLDHLCRVRRCVNPDHLEPVTLLENQARIPRWVHSSASPNTRRSHCAAGHPYTTESTYHYFRNGTPRRACKICAIARQRVRRAREKQAA